MRFFVYGTLMDTQPNAKTLGVMYDLGFYPGVIFDDRIVIDYGSTDYETDVEKLNKNAAEYKQILVNYINSANAVCGQIKQIHDIAQTDHYEGFRYSNHNDSLYVRVLIPVLNNDSPILCWAYNINPCYVSRNRQITNGIWRRH